MTVPRQEHSCGIVPSASGTGYEVIVAGGRERESYEIFSIETETFRPGNNMTFGITEASDIRVDDTFVMVGGRIYDEQGSYHYSDKLIKYLPESGTFMELPGKMKT